MDHGRLFLCLAAVKGVPLGDLHWFLMQTQSAAPNNTTENPPDIEAGAFSAYFIIDVADQIDIKAVAKIEGLVTNGVQMNANHIPSPTCIEFPSPPLAVSVPDTVIRGRDTSVRLRLYEYGVVAIRLTFPFAGTWSGFVELTEELRFSDDLWIYAQEVYQRVKPQIDTAVKKPHSEELVEDYFVSSITSFAQPITSETLTNQCAAQIASLLRAEKKKLSRQEVDEVMRMQLSYFETDLCIVEWDAALVYDRPESAEVIENILEFANTQLVELRTYDKRINAELDWIYKTDPIEAPRGLLARKTRERAQRLQLVSVDIRELIDRTNNALKITGDAFYARVYRNIRARLGLSDWEKQIDEKLESVSVVYEFLNDQIQHRRSEFLEIIIIALITFEIFWEFVKPH